MRSFSEDCSAYVDFIYSGTLSTQERRLSHYYLEHLCLVSVGTGLIIVELLRRTFADTSESFAMIRGGHIDVSILGVSMQARQTWHDYS